ncbi:MAG: L,D-transpeptidase family protein [Clostridia bacterium]|nr:L,D-transpeptidase family protein [Clostridia bacterium]
MRRALAILCIAAIISAVFMLFTAAETPTKLIYIDTLRMSLILYENGKEVRRFPIAAGAADTPSPIGVFRIIHRFKPEGGGFGTRFLGLNVPWGSYGIHGTNKPGSIGSHASHGCFRMYSRDAETLYALVPNGTPVIVEHGPYGELGTHLLELRPLDRGSQVRAVQRKLLALGFYGGSLDGIFGAGTVTALQGFLTEKGMEWEGRVDQKVYDALGLILFE